MRLPEHDPIRYGESSVARTQAQLESGGSARNARKGRPQAVSSAVSAGKSSVRAPFLKLHVLEAQVDSHTSIVRSLPKELARSGDLVSALDA